MSRAPLSSPARSGPRAVGMFKRRLLLLGALIVAGLALPVGRLIQLTIVRGGELRARAEARLLSEQWQPSVRGRILDRKGRVLAEDRPTFHIAVDYEVISGQWAFRQAARAARRSAGAERWRQLSPVQREQLVATFVPRFRERLDADWRTFARLAGVSIEELEARKAAIVAEVSRTASTIWEQRRLRLEEAASRGRELVAEVPLSAVARPIREQTAPHIILRNVDDPTAFRFLFSGEVEEEDPEPGDARSGPASRRLPGVHVLDATARHYPLEDVPVVLDRSRFPGPLATPVPLQVTVSGAMTNLVGWMRDRLFAEDVARRPRLTPEGTIDRGFYAPGDSVGSAGLEASAEDDLRGLRGLERRRLDTGEVTSIDRAPGRDVQITLDAVLQARVAAILSPEAGLAVVQPWQNNRALPLGTPLPAAAVVLEVDSGDVLAMVSTPGFTRRELREEPQRIFGDEAGMPALNRAIARPYAPGSIVKPLMYVAAVAEGVWDVDRRVECTGHLFPDRPTMFRCWIYKNPPHITHTIQLGGALRPDQAIAVSCNLYFFNVGRALGPERIVRWYTRWGIGPEAMHPALGVGPMFPGSAGAIGSVPVFVPDSDVQEMGEPPSVTAAATAGDELDPALRPDADAPGAPPRRGVVSRRAPVSPSESILMGIGQGPIAWTPLHAADAYATLARGGVRILPRTRLDAPPVVDRLPLSQRSVEIALEGLRAAVSDERGTGFHMTIETPDGPRRERIFTVPGVQVWGKSGTADSGRLARDAFGATILDPLGRPVSVDHSWFVVLVGPRGDRPRYAIAVLIEGGGSGGRVAGPVTNQIIAALIAEGYL